MPALADPALDQQELELLDRFVGDLREEYGDDLDAVWLYGSRARGERSHDESDIDLLVVTQSERDDESLIPILWRALDALGNPRIFVDPRQRSRAWWRTGVRSTRSSSASSTWTRSCSTAGREPAFSRAAGSSAAGHRERASAGRGGPRRDGGLHGLLRHALRRGRARSTQRAREASDYAAETFEISEAHALVATAERFVAEVERLTG